MKLIDLKLPKLSKKEREENMKVAPYEGEKYPYGMRLNFGKETINKIKALKSVQAGATVNIQGRGKVVEVRITDEEKGRTRHNIEIQIQKIAVADTGSYSESFKEATE